MNNGEKVKDAKTWWTKRRPEIVEYFDREVYGRFPKNIPNVTWKVNSIVHEKNGDIDVITKKLSGVVDNSSFPSISVTIDLTLSTPANATGPVPVIMEFGFNFPPGFRLPSANSDQPTWQQQLLMKGWGYAMLLMCPNRQASWVFLY